MNAAPQMINYMRYQSRFAALSLAAIVFSIVGLAVKGLNFGIDFTGGTLIEIAYIDQQPETLEPIRDALKGANFTGASVQYFGGAKDVLIRVPPQDSMDNNTISERVSAMITHDAGSIEVRRVEYVGPQIGEGLVKAGIEAMLIAMLGVLVYVAFRFQLRFAAGAILALVHDVVITLGFFSWAGIEFDLPTLAAILALIGYSLNDTIVVFDRIRDNFRLLRTTPPLSAVNISVNQTMCRSITTSFSTLLVVFSLFFMGGESIHGFSIALIFGIIIGTYSSIFIASAVALALGANRQDMVTVAAAEGSS